ncbi:MULTISPECIES: hypothetical protein [unclassified Arthrobacter]|uniref:hypothetical protein n=1 Tax=unclassified Arthrobacter TaxID=235627 RepID=UPI0012F895D6|nr:MULTISPECIES: hypothetical protein [unclassified Arthrobacter]
MDQLTLRDVVDWNALEARLQGCPGLERRVCPFWKAARNRSTKQNNCPKIRRMKS